MSADTTPDQPRRADSGPRVVPGEVVDLDTWTRAARPVPADIGSAEPPATAPADDDDSEPGGTIEGTVIRVDQPGPGRLDGEWLARLTEAARHRRPIIHPVLKSRAEAAATARWVAAHYAHVSGYHATRSPKYAARLAVRAPRGTARVIGGVHRWAFDAEGHPVRVASVLRADAETYLKLSRQRDARVRLRAPVALAADLIAVAVVVVVLVLAPPLLLALAVSAAVGVLGALGRPHDAPPLIDRAVVASRVEKLTSEIVYRALGAVGIAALGAAIARNPHSALEFKAPITRDGPGWRADLDLPYGVTVAEVQEKRDKLASGLRRPIGCVWPEPDHTAHPGRLVLWVGDQDMSKARQPAWPLATRGDGGPVQARRARHRPARAHHPGHAHVRLGHHRVHPADGQDVPAAAAAADRRPRPAGRGAPV